METGIIEKEFQFGYFSWSLFILEKLKKNPFDSVVKEFSERLKSFQLTNKKRFSEFKGQVAAVTDFINDAQKWRDLAQKSAAYFGRDLSIPEDLSSIMIPQPTPKPVIKLTPEEMDELANNTVKYACDVAGFEDAFGHREDGDFDNCFDIGNYEISVSGYCFMEGGQCISRGDYWNEPEYADTYYDFSLHDVVIYDKDTEQEFVLSKEDFDSLEEKIKEML